MNEIIIKGAREHNLKNINIKLPRDKLIVITGLSGSGKSTLAFDTIYAEGQRRYVESLSAYARQFLGQMNKPDVDSIEGLSPAISIEQKTTSKNPRSTVGTVTEIFDYLRLLFARIGTPHCPKCGKEIRPQTAQMISKKILEEKNGKRLIILSPVIRGKKGTYEKLLEKYQKEGFARVRVDKKIYEINENNIKSIKLDRYVKHYIEVVCDRLVAEDPKRLNESVELALSLSGGFVIFLDDDENEVLFSAHAACPDCGINFEEMQPRMFSFNNPFGACQECHGLGFKQEFDSDLIIPNKELSLVDGAIACYNNDGWRTQQIYNVAKHFGIDIFAPVNNIAEDDLNLLLYGTDERIRYKYVSKNQNASYNFYGGFEGVIPQFERLYHQTKSDYRRREMEKFMRFLPCPKCNGKRLKEEALAVTLGGKNIIELTDLSISDSISFFNCLKLDENQMIIAKQVLKEINSRLKFLDDVGLSYLTMSRSAGTLSGGEAQRIRLATQIGSNLVGVLYVLDEPSIGLHQRDNNKLIGTLKRLRDIGNTLIVVEHDEGMMLSSDHIIDLGPGAGIHGGDVIFEGEPVKLKKSPDSLTGLYLCGKKKIDVPKKRRRGDGFITIVGASQNNLKNIEVSIPEKVLTVVTGVSGSGKSTLVHEILYKALMKRIYNSKEIPGSHKDILSDIPVERVILVDQSPIGRTPRSNPATYTKVFDEIRTLFSKTKEAKIRGYKPGRFSFNVSGGRCENCKGDGLIKIEMNFLPDVYVECEECKGTRYNDETLSVTYNHKNVAEVLDMTVEEAYSFFENIPRIKSKLQTLYDVGLGYIKLGQSATTLSGGEAQRIKLTRELSKRSKGHTVYILDEPTTGLHFDDVKKLLDVLQRLVKKGNSVIVIEHNLDVIKTADYIIDLGPEGGDAGGEVIAKGTPEEIAKDENSYTGDYLKKVL